MTPTALRRLLHAASAAILLLLLLSPAALRAGTFALVLGAGVFETLRLRVPGLHARLAARVPVFRPQESSRVSGAAWLALGYSLAAWTPSPGPLAGILAGALADPAAAWAGARWGAGPGKSWPGTVAAAAVGAAAAVVAGLSVPAGIAAGVLGAALERRPGPFDDNLLVPPGVAAAAALLA